jgi:Mn2+/Fe2+ NRAMP family transporter
MAPEALPEPPKPGVWSYLKAVGPGVILGSMAIGSGEWILFPAIVVKYGPYLLWAALLSCIIQAVVAVESMKYAVYSGQPIHKAYQKLPPSPLAWAWAWTLLIFIPVIWPGWAAASATAIAALQLGRLPGPQDAYLVLAWGIVALTVGLLVIHFGEKIQRTLELVSWPILVLLVATIIAGVVMAASPQAWLEVLSGFGGFLKPRLGFPSQGEINWYMIAAAIAYIPAGFGFNLFISSYARDKGWGMGSKAGYISGLVGGNKVELRADEIPFDVNNQENLRRWREWLKIMRLDSYVFFSGITMVTVILTSVMAYALLVPRGLAPTGFQVAAAQAEALSAVLGWAAWVIVLLGGFWALFDTQWGIMDSVARTVTDNFWFASEWVRRMTGGDPRKIYYAVVYAIYALSVIILVISTVYKLAEPYHLSATGAVLGLLALTLAPILQLVVSNRILPKPLRPGIVTNIILAVGVVFYGFFIAAVVLQMFFKITL